MVSCGFRVLLFSSLVHRQHPIEMSDEMSTVAGLRVMIRLRRRCDSIAREIRRGGPFLEAAYHPAVRFQPILAIKSGTSLVLDGPPGTGKSQTIANVIAKCLAGVAGFGKHL